MIYGLEASHHTDNPSEKTYIQNGPCDMSWTGRAYPSSQVKDYATPTCRAYDLYEERACRAPRLYKNPQRDRHHGFASMRGIAWQMDQSLP